MSETIMPCFDRFPEEGKTIGRLLAGYGELELELCLCVAATTNDLDAAIKRLFGKRGEEKRIKTADVMMSALFNSVGLGTKDRATIKNMDWCRSVRNQYAHCNWYDTPTEGLCFVDLEHTARLKSKIAVVAKHRHPLSAALLIEQETYFRVVQKCFWYLGEAYQRSTGKSLTTNPLHSWPAKMNRPLRHN